MSVTFIGMVAPYLRQQGRWNAPMLICVIGAGLMALATWQLPHKLGLIAAALTGIALGYSAYLWRQQQSQSTLESGDE